MILTVTIEKLVFGGQGLARLDDGRVAFVWNALPGEVVEAEVIKRKKNYIEAIALTIITPSPDRVKPKDTHFLSSSPWQMMSREAEAKWKKNIAAETYSKIADMILSPDQLELAQDEHMYGYRNKMEYSFAHVDATNDGDKANYHPTSIALFARGKHTRNPVDGASIADAHINATAKKIEAWIQTQRIPLRSLKSLIVRSNTAGDTIAALFIKDKLTYSTYPPLQNGLKGFHLYFSTHTSPASVPTQILYSEGNTFLVEDILGTKLTFGLLSFFQINVAMFTTELKDIAAFLDPKQPLVDYYAGVGAIGLPLSANRKQTILVESNKEAATYAAENIVANALPHCVAHCIPAEQMRGIISKEHAIIVDPPRAGLHEDVVKTLLQVGPPKVIYLSCNLSTQARDMRMLSQRYKPIFIKIYNFFPRTPHIEGLVVLEKIV